MGFQLCRSNVRKMGIFSNCTAALCFWQEMYHWKKKSSAVLRHTFLTTGEPG